MYVDQAPAKSAGNAPQKVASKTIKRKRRNLRPADWKFVGECYAAAQGDIERAAKMCGWQPSTVKKWRSKHPKKAASIVPSAAAGRQKRQNKGVAPQRTPEVSSVTAVPKDREARQLGEAARAFVMGFLDA